MMGRYVLPWFGGGPAVWTNCMLFFQAALLGGYAYAHWIGSRRSTKFQSWVHLALLAVSLLFLPIAPSAAIWKPVSNDDPSGRILLLLAATVGGPYLVLSATTPLLQKWFSLAKPLASPWRLYALSNFGSFLALLSYPFVVEPYFRLHTQTWAWSAMYGVFVILCGAVAWGVRTQSAAAPAPDQSTLLSSEPLKAGDVLLWLALSACASVLLLATTNQISQEIAVIPFLWIAPLSIYLLTFVLTFESGRWYRRGWFAAAAGVMAPVTCAVITAQVGIPLLAQLAVYLVSLFTICMLCHGELARSRPAAGRLTGFYLAIAAGGALGGLFTALIAPRIFSEFTEYPVALAVACALGFWAWLQGGAFRQWTSRNLAVRIPLMALLFGGVTSVVAFATSATQSLETRRNFYGILRVTETSQDIGLRRQVTHGRILHGFQFQQAEKRDSPTTYYGPHSGVARALKTLSGPRRVAVVGLGTGTLAAWGREGDTFRFYDINPDVIGIAQKWFSFLKDSKATIEIVPGDARVQLERELTSGRSHDFDFIAVDAFSSDAIPVHLLTTECADLYRQRLAPGGILALHISNRSLNLEPVTRGLAAYLGWTPTMVLATDLDTGESTSRWVLITNAPDRLEHAGIVNTIPDWSSPGQPAIRWSDDFSSLWHILRIGAK